MKVAVVGAGWAGLACAVRATEAGHQVTLYEMAPMPGGRARSDADAAEADNGQHILLGGYARTLDLMRTVGVEPAQVFNRLPLALATPAGHGFALRGGRPRLLDAAVALWQARGLDWRDKLAALRLAAHWHAARFRCAEHLSVDDLLTPVATPRLRRLLLDPLCVSALNTLPAMASAAVFLAVMRDGVFGAPGASDLLVPRVPLARLLPLPALSWLAAHGAELRMRQRVSALESSTRGWGLRVDGGDAGAAAEFDHVVLACSATEAARLSRGIAASWSALAGALQHEPIITLSLHLPAQTWPLPMLALESDATRPAQFAFHRGRLDDRTDRVALVVSAASAWLTQDSEALVAAALAQCRAAFHLSPDAPISCQDVRIDRRATFRCSPALRRPPRAVAPHLCAAGDYVEGPYPGTLEAAVQAGEAALPGPGERVV